MRKTIGFIFCLFLILGCAKKIKKPSHFLNEKQMIEILSELYIYQQNSYVKDYTREGINLSEVDAQIIKNHGVSIEDFKENHHYYVVQPEKFRKILLGVKENLESKLPDNERRKHNIKSKGK